MKKNFSRPSQASSQWSNRILILSIIGIVGLTFFPFRFDFAATHSHNASPFLLGPSLKHGEYVDFFLNALLFVPFGFGLAAQVDKRGVSRGRALLLALVAGACTSYTVEFLQFYIPTRNSAWDDVTPNTLGAVLGFLLFDRSGETLLKHLSAWEERLEAWMSLRRARIFLLAYLGFFFVLSISLQRETLLSDWDTTVPMFVGSDGTARHAWKGQITKLQVWNRALSDESALRLSAGEPVQGVETGLLASYEFIGTPPYSDQEKTLPALTWISSSPAHDSKVLDLNGSSWLSTKVPATGLTQELKRTNQFAVRAVCTPADVADLEQIIVSISQVYGTPDLTLWRDRADLVFWFRNSLSMHRSFLAWHVRGVFVPEQTRDIVFSYDGSTLSLYIDGKKETRVYHLSPGAALTHKFLRILTINLDGYLVIYDLLIFLPAGLLLGMVARKEPSREPAVRFWLLLGLLLPSVFYQLILVWVSGKALFWWETILCMLFALLGAWLANADSKIAIGENELAVATTER
jgi:glycopeptide antibiotics resistance protein